MGLDRARADHQGLRDLPVALAHGHQPQHVDLPAREQHLQPRLRSDEGQARRSGGGFLLRARVRLQARQLRLRGAHVVHDDTHRLGDPMDPAAQPEQALDEDRALQRVSEALGEHPQDGAVVVVDVAARHVAVRMEEADHAIVRHDRRGGVGA